ncbi:hypothetical protein DM02DRAFT_644731 [Periconia macrospinosa]|uniref:BZIP domain-containing protein n=1 Tax=Periconia macrospinosa TaxID=97972 RepID=A0A2V1DES7_9PLEO|nr:hypothetical protein DM02DRAFT_644731 [Periconia macrospinosa]
MAPSCIPVDSIAPRIALASKPQLVEARRTEDDWTGTTDAAARRRAQTRLNTRAYRKRKALAKKNEACSNTPDPALLVIKSEPLIECWDDTHQTVSTIPSSRLKRLFDSKSPLLPENHKYQHQQSPNIIFPLSSDHLIVLLQYNALRGLTTNRSLITGLFITPLACTAEEVIHTVPYPSNPSLIPPQLLPTYLQQTVPHADWIDIFPSAEGRDRLIRAAGTFDEDDLWADCIGGLFEGFPADEIANRGIVAWSPPWDIAGWEMTEGFLRKWGWLFGGLPGGLEATNRWRAERGEEPLGVEEFGFAHRV